MDIETLSNFWRTADKSVRQLAPPFSDAEWSYSLTESSLLCVPRLPDVPVNDELCKRYINGSVANMLETTPECWVKVSPLKPMRPEPCSACGGAGKEFTCPECDGSGTVEWENEFHWYESLCDTCGGKGVISQERFDR
jgi:hypothetical protein